MRGVVSHQTSGRRLRSGAFGTQSRDTTGTFPCRGSVVYQWGASVGSDGDRPRRLGRGRRRGGTRTDPEPSGGHGVSLLERTELLWE